MVGTELQLSGVEYHHSVGPGERYHGPLRPVYLKIRYENPTVNKCYFGPYPGQRVDGTQVFVIVNGKEVQHNLDPMLLAD